MAGLIDQAQLREAFSRLALELQRDGTVGEIYVFGGAPMVLAFDARQVTRDVDALFAPRERVHGAALRVAEALELPRWWLNDQVPPGTDPQPRVLFDHPNLRVSTASAVSMLAMKAMAARAYADVQDIELLCEHLGVSTAAEVEAICSRAFPGEPLSGRARIVVEDIVEEIRRERALRLQPGPDREGPGLGL